GGWGRQRWDCAFIDDHPEEREEKSLGLQGEPWPEQGQPFSERLVKRRRADSCRFSGGTLFDQDRSDLRDLLGRSIREGRLELVERVPRSNHAGAPHDRGD